MSDSTAPKVRGELVITIDETGAVNMGVTGGELKTDDLLLMLKKAQMMVDMDIAEKLTMARALAAHQNSKTQIQPGHSGQLPGNGPHKRF